VIVIIGSPAVRPGEPGQRATAAGQAADVGRGAVEGGSVVQLVGKIGDDPAGDALLVALAESGIGHAAILRDPSRPTPAPPAASADADEDPFSSDRPAEDLPDMLAPAEPALDAEDLELALRYLPDHRVVVVAEPLGPEALASVANDCSYVGAQLIVILGAGATAAGLPAEATILEAPDDDPDGIFGRTVGLFAAAIDQGRPASEALVEATSGSGWTPVGE
jgi:sugar/nucleoside kinase (ribokinase family)